MFKISEKTNNQDALKAKPIKKQRSAFSRVVTAHLRRVRKDIFFASFCIIGSTLTTLIIPWPMKLIFDNVLSDKALPDFLMPFQGYLTSGSTKTLLILCGSMIAIALVRGFFAYYQLFLTSRIGYLLVYVLRGELFNHLQRLSLSFHHKTRTGELLNKLTSDTNNLKDVFADSALTFTTHILTVIGMLAIMFNLNVQLGLIVLISFPILFFAIYFIYSRVKYSARNQRHNESRLASRVAEILGAVPLIQAYGTEDFEHERFEADSSRSMKESIRTSRMEAAATRLVEIISAFGTAIVVLFGCIQAVAGKMTPGDVLIFASYMSQIYQPIRQITRLSTRFSRASVSIERINSILETEPEIQDAPDAIKVNRLSGDIAFDNVTFSYVDGKKILDDVSFRIMPGERVALVGASGAGKSTIANLIIRLYDPQKGAVLIDRQNINQYERASLRQEIGVVLQDPVLFGTSIKENIAYGKSDATQEEIELAAKQVHAHDFIMNLPDGYDTLMAESGNTLSGGQRQRISLARALIRQASILIMDEPTSAVDAESQALIRDAMARLQQGRTILLIAHQFHTIRDFDRILVLKNGKIIEEGSHNKLMQLGGYYHELYRLQHGIRMVS
ncbi:ABC-type multidrug transport system, ATPase and permease component [Methyloglobulus morosus KoM1]|uniref:ABC-type multidrug transport system, ATPase and permease component n=1 Tax=Methyloglobulus morosus KoM1 TaxID=1116472 RepID=V5BSR2_9GAMM|nr:ABC transporter ATP-binding protein [Methyloglobulus morosus]ESS67578.1 ABC-type multidrug transport system, ATPase and permease component [Methyloglobulus morosus KoM1]